MDALRLVDWRLVVNLFFLLLLLFRARGAWLDQASDDELRRRAARRQLVTGVAFFAAVIGIQAGLGLLFARHEQDFTLVWTGILIVSALANIGDKKRGVRPKFTGFTRV